MKRFLFLAFVILCWSFVAYKFYQIRSSRLTVPEHIMETIVGVDGSSGIVIHSDEDRALVITSYHVVDRYIDVAACCGCEYGLAIVFMSIEEYGWPYIVRIHRYSVTNIEFDSDVDLAILNIKSDGDLFYYSHVSKEDPRVGDDIWIGSNPDGNYRSLKKGVVSSLERSSSIGHMWEVSGGIIYGSSGGGAFTEDGELFGIAAKVNEHVLYGQCYDVWDDNGEYIGSRCIAIPTPYIGFIVPPDAIRKFLLSTSYAEYFDYLR